MRREEDDLESIERERERVKMHRYWCLFNMFVIKFGAEAVVGTFFGY